MTTKFTWYGHATLGLETSGYKIIVDPFFSGNPAASSSAEAVEADFILISHGHGDHVGDAIALAKRTDATIISVNEIAVWCGAVGQSKDFGSFKNFRSLVKSYLLALRNL